MIFFILIVAVLALACTRKRNENGRILSKSDTGTINGIFVYLIFLSHSTQYYTLNNTLSDQLYEHFQNFHNQWVVATFLAFSGYGVMWSIIEKGKEYVHTFPKKRLLKTLFNFDIAVLLFFIVNHCIGSNYSVFKSVFSFIGLTSIGNSNWYIFTILLMYLLTYIAAVLVGSQHRRLVGIVTGCSIVYIVVAHLTGLPSRFVSTVACYPLGMWLALYKDQTLRVFKEKWIVSLFGLLILIVITYKLRYNDYIMNFASCVFVLLVVLFLAHFEIKSRILGFLGKHSFSIYILQRLPMNILTHFYEPKGSEIYLFSCVCLCITIAVAVLFDLVLDCMDKKLFLR